MTRTPAAPTDPRRFYKIGDAARIVGVKPHVLRYWESEFPELRPLKTRGAHRMYGAEHLSLARRIRELVVDRGYTVAGARRQLRADRSAHGGLAPDGDEALALRRELLAVRARLAALLDELGAADPAPPRAATAPGTVDAPKVVLVEGIAPAAGRGRHHG